MTAESYIASTWMLDNWDPDAVNYPSNKDPWARVPGKRADIQYRTTQPGTLKLFLKKLPKEDEQHCERIDFMDGLGYLLMQEGKLVLIELWQVGVQYNDTPLLSDNLPPLQLYHSYEPFGDRLQIFLRGSEMTPANYPKSLLPAIELGLSNMFGCDNQDRVVLINIFFATELLPSFQD